MTIFLSPKQETTRSLLFLVFTKQNKGAVTIEPLKDGCWNVYFDNELMISMTDNGAQRYIRAGKLCPFTAPPAGLIFTEQLLGHIERHSFTHYGLREGRADVLFLWRISPRFPWCWGQQCLLYRENVWYLDDPIQVVGDGWPYQWVRPINESDTRWEHQLSHLDSENKVERIVYYAENGIICEEQLWRCLSDNHWVTVEEARTIYDHLGFVPFGGFPLTKKNEAIPN